MHQISIASILDKKEVLTFLEKQELIVNNWLIRSVYDALQRCADWDKVVICRLHDEIVGVAYILEIRRIPENANQPDFNPQHDYEVQMDAVDNKAVKALIEAFPIRMVGNFRVFRPMIQEYFQNLSGATRTDGDLYFTVSSEYFQPVTGEKVIELVDDDAYLFEGCEKKRSNLEESRIFVITRNNRIATSVEVGIAKPIPEIKKRVIPIVDLYTETKYRRMGLGKQLVSHVTEVILHNGHNPIYWTEPENIASQALAMKLGYRQVGQVMTFCWTKKI